MAEKQALVKKFNQRKKKLTFKIAAIVFLTVLLGVGSGWFLSSTQLLSGGSKLKTAEEVKKGKIVKGMVVGSKDETTFKDIAEGELKKGGIDGEGSHHLERPGGPSQNVYLTSSIVDLDRFTDRKVKVWGETFASQKAGWLMDVGKLEVLD